MTALEKQFDEMLKRNATEAQEKCDCRLVRMVQQAEKFGGVKMAKELLRKGKQSDDFEKLAEAGLLHLTLEALIIDPQYGDLFTDDEVNSCYEILCEHGYY